ncbi:MAG: hypothetical protein ACK4GE_00095 [Caldimicrobium sp.]
MVLKNKRIAVIGAGLAEPSLYELAYQVGYLLGKEGGLHNLLFLSAVALARSQKLP